MNYWDIPVDDVEVYTLPAEKREVAAQVAPDGDELWEYVVEHDDMDLYGFGKRLPLESMDIDDITEWYVMPRRTVAGDYSGTPVERANMRYLCETYPDWADEHDLGSYCTTGALIRLLPPAERTEDYEWLWDEIRELDHYPTFDGAPTGKVESELLDEYIEDVLVRDINFVIMKYDGRDYPEDIDKRIRKWCDKTGVEWESMTSPVFRVPVRFMRVEDYLAREFGFVE